jgi:trehalose/maltose hydrolase-like predicted phosphorylase
MAKQSNNVLSDYLLHLQFDVVQLSTTVKIYENNTHNDETLCKLTNVKYEFIK